MHEDELKMLRESACALIAERSPPSALRAIRDGADSRGFDPEFWKHASGLGWSGILVPAQHGGSELGISGAGVLAREMGRQLVLSPLLSSVLAATAFTAVEGPTEEWLTRIAAGEVIVAVAADHLASAENGSVSVIRGERGYRLTGQVRDVLDGHIADAILVAAASEEGAMASLLFLVHGAAHGLVRSVRKLVDGRRVGDLQLNGVEVATSHSLALKVGVPSSVERILDAGRLFLAARLCGTAEGAFARTLEYLKERVQFGRRIGSFQALQHRAAHLHCQIEDAWSATLKAMTAFDQDAPERAFATAVAKAKANEVASRVTAECLQLHGGIGMTDECDIGLYLKHARVDAELLGSYTFHADRVARHLGY